MSETVRIALWSLNFRCAVPRSTLLFVHNGDKSVWWKVIKTKVNKGTFMMIKRVLLPGWTNCSAARARLLWRSSDVKIIHYSVVKFFHQKLSHVLRAPFTEANTKEMGLFPVIRQNLSWFWKSWVHHWWSLLAFSYLLDRKLPPNHIRHHDTGISQASCTLRSFEERQTQAWRYQPVQDKPCFPHGSVFVLVVKCECYTSIIFCRIAAVHSPR